METGRILMLRLNKAAEALLVAKEAVDSAANVATIATKTEDEAAAKRIQNPNDSVLVDEYTVVHAARVKAVEDLADKKAVKENAMAAYNAIRQVFANM